MPRRGAARRCPPAHNGAAAIDHRGPAQAGGRCLRLRRWIRRPVRIHSVRRAGAAGRPLRMPGSPHRVRILEAMVRVAAEKGLETATVAEVIAMADVSKETFDSMFEGKEACFLEAYDAVVDFMLGAHSRPPSRAPPDERWPERIAAALRALVELLGHRGRHRPHGDGRGAGRGRPRPQSATPPRWTASHRSSKKAGRPRRSERRACPPTPPASRSAAPAR